MNMRVHICVYLGYAEHSVGECVLMISSSDKKRERVELLDSHLPSPPIKALMNILTLSLFFAPFEYSVEQERVKNVYYTMTSHR